MNINSRLLNEAKELEGRWGQTGLLDGIEDKSIRATTAVLLENQRLVNEVSTDTGDVAQFKRISIPLVRRIYPQLIANKIVSVQPLLGPTGLVYYLRFRYATNKGDMRGADLAAGAYSTANDAGSMQQLASGDANLSNFYSSQVVSEEKDTTAVSGATSVHELEFTPVLAGTLVIKVYDSADLLLVTGTVDTAGTSVVGVNSSNFALNDAEFTPAFDAGAGTGLDHSDGTFTMAWTSPLHAGDYLTFTYEYNMEGNTVLPEVNLAIESEEIAAKTRKLKAVWTYEAQQDLRSQHNLDAEAELTAVLAQEINLEIDREIINDLITSAGTLTTWTMGSTFASGDTIKEKYESLFVKCTEVSNVIHRKTLRGGANWIICSPEVAAIFETATAGFAPAPSESFTSSLGVQYVGTVANRWRLYKDPLFPAGKLLMGYKGDSYMDSGYFYCPYVPLTQTPVVLDPEGFVPRKGILTRYGKKLLREGAKFYATLTVQNAGGTPFSV
jgi:hypothetical protein